MGWLNDFGNWAGDQLVSAGSAIAGAAKGVAGEAIKLVRDPLGYAFNAADTMIEGMNALAKDAATLDPKAGFKLLGNVVGFVPVVGDLGEIACHGIAAGIGICQNPSNWRGELVSFAGEAAIAAIPGPNVVAAGKLMTQAVKGFGKEVGEIGLTAAKGNVRLAAQKTKKLGRDSFEIAVHTPVNAVKNLADEAAGQLVLAGGKKTALHTTANLIMPGASFIKTSVKRGLETGTYPLHLIKDTAVNGYKATASIFSRKAAKELAENGYSRTAKEMGEEILAQRAARNNISNILEESFPVNALADRMRLSSPSWIPGAGKLLSKIPAAPKLVFGEAMDEVWENAFLEPAFMKPIQDYTANLLSNHGHGWDGKGDFVTITSTDHEKGNYWFAKNGDFWTGANNGKGEVDQFAGNVRNALAANGINLPETAEDFGALSPEKFAKQVTDSTLKKPEFKGNPESIEDIKKYAQELGQYYVGLEKLTSDFDKSFSTSKTPFSQREWDSLHPKIQEYLKTNIRDKFVAGLVPANIEQYTVKGSPTNEKKEFVWGLIDSEDSKHLHRVVYDLEKRVPVTERNADDYVPLFDGITTEKLFNTAQKVQKEVTELKEAHEEAQAEEKNKPDATEKDTKENKGDKSTKKTGKETSFNDEMAQEYAYYASLLIKAQQSDSPKTESSVTKPQHLESINSGDKGTALV